MNNYQIFYQVKADLHIEPAFPIKLPGIWLLHSGIFDSLLLNGMSFKIFFIT